MAHIEELRLCVVQPEAQARFYREVLGMGGFGECRIGYGSPQAFIRFERGTVPYAPDQGDLYWKIALSVPNIDLAHEQLTKRGIAVTTPRQFEDVGYLAKFTDPEGFEIELLDHWFKGDRPEGEWDPETLGGGAHLSLITLRTHDVTRMREICEGLGMTLLSIQPLDQYGFTLYFYAFTDERPPNPDLHAVENRSWVYRRPYTVLEVQHVHRMSDVKTPDQRTCGYLSTGLRDVPVNQAASDLLGLQQV